MKKSTIFLIITIPTIIIIGLGYLGFDFFMNQMKINLAPFTKDTAITINKKMLELPDKYPNSKNTKDIVLDTVNIQFFDDDLNDYTIKYGNDALISKTTSLIGTIKQNTSEFNLQENTLYYDSFNIYFDYNKQLLNQFIDDINKSLKEASISDQSSFVTYENPSGNALGKVSKNTDGSFTILFICTNYYEKID